MAYSTWVYGLHVRSTVALPGRASQPFDAAPDLALDLAQADGCALPPSASPWIRARAVVHDERLGITVDWWRSGTGADLSIRLALRHEDRRYELVVQPGGARVWGRWTTPGGFAHLEALLMGPILGTALRLQGRCALHASAVVVDGQAILLLGPKGAGKSTTAATLSGLGCPVLTDDIAAFTLPDDGVLVHPGYPRLRLREEAVPLVQAPTDRLAPAWQPSEHWSTKQYLDVSEGGRRFASRPHPLAAIYLLEPFAETSTHAHVQAVPPARALLDVMPHAYAPFPLDAVHTRTAFTALSALVQRAPVFSLARVQGPEGLAEAAQRVLEHARSLPADGLGAPPSTSSPTRASA